MDPNQPPQDPRPSVKGPDYKFESHNEIEETKRLSRKLVFIVSLFLAVMIPASIYGYGQLKKQQIAQTPTPTIAPKATPTPDPTANWQTYTATGSGFSFKYPADWKLTDNFDKYQQVDIEKQHVVPGYTPKEADELPDKAHIAVYVQPNTKFTSTQEWLNSEVNLRGFNQMPRVEDLKVAGENAIKTVLPEQALSVNWIIFLHDNKIYEIYYEDFSPQAKKIDDQVVPLILSTFKFTDQNSVDISSWKTYQGSDKAFTTNDWSNYEPSNTIVPFSIKYPPTWTKDYTVFHEGPENKIAEFSPGAVALSDSGKCFDKPLGTSGGELEEETPISIGSYDGVKRIVKTDYEGGPNGSGTWYANLYCVQSGNKAFIMAFYEKTLGTGIRNTFDTIMSTFKFTQ